MAQLVPLTLRHYMRFHGEPPPYRIRGVAVIDDDQPVAVGGIGFHKGWLEVFMDMREGGARFPKLLLKGGKEVIRMGEEYNLPMFAVQNDEMSTAPRFLERLGFQKLDNDVWSI